MCVCVCVYIIFCQYSNWLVTVNVFLQLENRYFYSLSKNSRVLATPWSWVRFPGKATVDKNVSHFG